MEQFLEAARTFLASVLLVFLVAEQAVARQERQHLWVDTDAACVSRFATDVDDCWALALLLNSPSIQIVGISTVFGNRDKAPSARELRAHLRLISPAKSASNPMRIVVGAHEPVDRVAQISNAAADAIIAELEKAPLTVLALGPLTNVAIVARQRPDLRPRIKSIIAVAGQRPGERFFPGKSRLFHVHDMNFRKDVDSFETVLALGTQFTLVPYAAGSQVMIDKSRLKLMEQETGPARWLAGISGEWLRFWQNYFGLPGFFPFDLVAAGSLVFPHAMRCRETRVRVVRRRGLFTQRDTLEVDPKFGRPVSYCDGVEEKFSEQLISGILN